MGGNLMATDARISTGLPSHPKTKKLVRRLGPGAGWGLVCLFLWVASNRSDGDLSGMSTEDIELAADWDGDDGVLVKELCDVRFLDGEEGSYIIHDWAEHNPWAAGSKGRSAAAKENASKKWGGDLASQNAGKRSQRLSEARAKGTHTADQWVALKAICGPACLRCGATDKEIVKDHIVPIYKGGSDAIDNLQPICRSCNSAKGPDCTDLRPADWFSRLQIACEMPAESEETPAPSPSPSPSPSPYPTPTLNTEPTVLVDTPAANRPPACPNAEIVDLYHQRLPTLPRVDVLSDGRKRTIAARWKDVLNDPDIKKSSAPRDAALEFFDWFFDHASKSRFLTGRVKDWRADLDFLMTPSKFVKVIEGHYHKEHA